MDLLIVSEYVLCFLSRMTEFPKVFPLVDLVSSLWLAP